MRPRTQAGPWLRRGFLAWFSQEVVGSAPVAGQSPVTRHRYGSRQSGGAFVQDAPLPALANPVLALAHLVGEVAARVILVERDHGQVVAAGVEEHAHLVELELDPGLAAVHLAFLLGPLREVGA